LRDQTLAASPRPGPAHPPSPSARAAHHRPARQEPSAATRSAPSLVQPPAPGRPSAPARWASDHDQPRAGRTRAKPECSGPARHPRRAIGDAGAPRTTAALAAGGHLSSRKSPGWLPRRGNTPPAGWTSPLYYPC